MTITQLRKNCNLTGLTYLLGFMEKFCWDNKPKITPFADRWYYAPKPTKKSKTRLAMEKAAQYIAQCEQGIGLDSKKFISSMNTIKNWKHWFVEYMQDKDNKQLVEACDQRIWNAKLNHKVVNCDHKDHKLGKDGAAKLADNLFRMFYDTEVRAKQEEPMDPYHTRQAGPVEWGQSMSENTFLPRQFAEQPTGQYYSISDDEHASGWKMSEYSDDEVVTEDAEILPIRIDWEDRNERYFELRQDVLHRKFSNEKILAKAKMLATTDLISWTQFHKLRQFAVDVIQYGNK